MSKKILFVPLVLCILLLSGMAEECFADASAQLEQAQTYINNGQYEQAEEIYQQVVTDYPGTDHGFQAQKNLAILYVAWDKQPQAEAAFQKLMADFSKHEGIAKAVTQIADTYRKVEKHKKARELYHYVVSSWPDAEHGMWSQMGLVISNTCLGNDNAAQTAFEKLRTEYAGYELISKAVCFVADNYRKLKKHEKACEHYQYVLGNWPDAEVALWSQMGLAISNVWLGDYDAAEAAVDKLRADFSEDERMAIAGCLVADEYRKLEKHQKALVLYQYVVNNWPDAEHAMWSQLNLAISNTALKNDDAALAAIDKLLVNFSGQPKFPSAVFQIGELYYKQAFMRKSKDRHAQANQYFQKAITEWEKIITELPQSITTAWAYNFSADCYRQLGQHEKSIEYYQRVLDDWPDYEYAWDALLRMGRNYEELKKSGLISKSQAYPKIKAAYEQLLEKYPTCPAARHARRWLSRHNSK